VYADLSEAALFGAILSGSELSKAYGVDQAQLD
jgi:hypothetical protein